MMYRFQFLCFNLFVSVHGICSSILPRQIEKVTTIPEETTASIKSVAPRFINSSGTTISATSSPLNALAATKQEENSFETSLSTIGVETAWDASNRVAVGTTTSSSVGPSTTSHDISSASILTSVNHSWETTSDTSSLITVITSVNHVWEATTTSYAFPLATSATEKVVTVGTAGKLVFNPDRLTADIGNTVLFNFLQLNHTLTQSTLTDPCTSAGQFNTEFNQFNPKNKSGRFVVRLQVTSTSPQWFFCAQSNPKSHCQAGMIFALNPNQSFDDFASAATKSTMLSLSTGSESSIETISTAADIETSTSLTISQTKSSLLPTETTSAATDIAGLFGLNQSSPAFSHVRYYSQNSMQFMVVVLLTMILLAI